MLFQSIPTAARINAVVKVNHYPPHSGFTVLGVQIECADGLLSAVGEFRRSDD